MHDVVKSKKKGNIALSKVVQEKPPSGYGGIQYLRKQVEVGRWLDNCLHL